MSFDLFNCSYFDKFDSDALNFQLHRSSQERYEEHCIIDKEKMACTNSDKDLT